MMGDQNDKQRRYFWSFMGDFRWRGMTPHECCRAFGNGLLQGALGCFSVVSSARSMTGAPEGVSSLSSVDAAISKSRISTGAVYRQAGHLTRHSIGVPDDWTSLDLWQA